MRVSRNWLVVLLFTLCLAASAQDWEALRAQGRQLIPTEPAKAVPLLQEALELCQDEKGPKDLQVGFLYGFLGQAYFKQAQYELAVESFASCLEITRELAPSAYGEILIWRGQALHELKRYQESSASLSEGLTLYSQRKGKFSSSIYYHYLRLLRLQSALKQHEALLVTAREFSQGLQRSGYEAKAPDLLEVGVFCYNAGNYALTEELLLSSLELAATQAEVEPEFLFSNKYWLALTQSGLGKKSECADTYREVVSLARQLDSPELATCQVAFGSALANVSKHEEALEQLAAVEQLKAGGRLWTLGYQRRGDCFRYLGKEDQAIEAFSKALPYAKAEQAAEILDQRAMCYTGLGFSEKALADIEKCLALRKSAAPDVLGFTYSRRGRILMDFDRRAESLQSLQRAVNLLKDDKGSRLGLTLGTLSHLLFSQGDYQMSLDVGERAVEHLSSSSESVLQRVVADAYKSQARRLAWLGRYQPAERHMKKSIELYQGCLELDNPTLLNGVFLLADILRKQGRAAEGLALYEQSLPLLESKLSRRDRRLAEAHESYASALSSAGRYDQARTHLNVSEGLFRDIAGADSYQRALTLARLAQLELARERPDLAYPVAKEAAGIAIKRGPERSLSVAVMLDIAGQACLRLYRRDGEKPMLEEAETWLTEAVRLSRTARSQVDDASRRIQSKDILGLYPRAVEVAVARGDLAKALTLSELATSRALLELMAGTPQPAAVREEIRSALAQSGVSTNKTGAAGVVDPLPVEQLLPALADDEIGYYILLGDRVSHGFLIDSSEIAYLPLPPRSELEGPALALGQQLAGGTVRAKLLGQTTVSEDHRVKLGELIWKGLPAGWVERMTGKTLVFVTTGRLQEIPFEVLPPPPGEPGRFLIENHAVAYAPSLSLLSHLRSRPRTPALDKYLLVGDPVYGGKPQTLASRYRSQDEDLAFTPLPFTKVETEAIAQVLGEERCDLWLGAEASEDKVMAARLSQYRVLHFACHGILGRNQGLGPALVLSQGASGNEDGFLRMEEVANLDPPLKADLVVLSACQTGRGKFQPGEGVESMARAFLRSGAQSVLVSLWTVDDRSTSKLMTQFYGYLNQGVPPPEALRRARLDLIKAGSPPGHWAPFILIGDGTQA